MELSLNILEHRNNLAKYVAGEMTVPETTEFETLVGSHPNNIELVKNMKNDWNIIGAKQREFPNTNRAWNNIASRINQEGLHIQNNSPRKKNKGSLVYWAVATIAIIVATSVYFTLGIQSQNVVIESTSGLSTLVHTLPDGSTVFLDANSQISFTKRFAKNNRKITLKGQAFFDITKNPEIPFIIETVNTNIEVLGTSFSVKSTIDSDFELVVQTGSVSIIHKSSNEENIVASPGDRITITNNHLTKSRESVTPLQNLQNKRLQFKDESLANIIQAINKTHQSNIVLSSPNIGSRRLTVTFVNNSVHSMVEVICKTLQLDAEYNENTITLWQP